MKFLFWQFALYAAAAFGLGFVAAWNFTRERLRSVEAALERTRARVSDTDDARAELQQARSAERAATQTAIVLQARLGESEIARSTAESDVESLRASRLKLLADLSELRGELDAVSVARARVTASEHEAIRLRGLLENANEQLRSERAGRDHTLAVLQQRLLATEAALALSRHAFPEPSAVSPLPSPSLFVSSASGGEPSDGSDGSDDSRPERVVDLRRGSDLLDVSAE